LEPLHLFSNGKLLITAEYLVMEGAEALAAPVKFGQEMVVERKGGAELHWNATESGISWFRASYSLPDLHILESTDHKVAGFLLRLLLEGKRINPALFEQEQGYRVTTNLTFKRNWGLGSSSTLITNLAAWFQADPFHLLWSVARGSGYDIACASAKGPVLYKLQNGNPEVVPVDFEPSFSNTLYFAYLGRKQDSSASIANFSNRQKKVTASRIHEMSQLTHSMLNADNRQTFAELMEIHEQLIGDLLGQEPIARSLFRGFPGAVKSLGAWGGDFAMICSDIGDTDVSKEFMNRGIKEFFTFDAIFLKKSINDIDK
jgi:mevalonate kinase